MGKKANKPRHLFLTQQDREALLASSFGPVGTYRKTARVLARQVGVPFTVATEHGEMDGAPGDWLVSNLPADDEGTDMWIVAGERFAQTYTPCDDVLTEGS